MPPPSTATRFPRPAGDDQRARGAAQAGVAASGGSRRARLQDLPP